MLRGATLRTTLSSLSSDLINLGIKLNYIGKVE